MSACRSSVLALRTAVLGVALGVVVLFLVGGRAAWAAAAPTLSETWVTNVAGGSATLAAQIDPEGAVTTYRFEYGATAAYGATAPSQPGDAGAGTSPVTVQAHIQGLLSQTTYHYRVVATNAGGTVSGPDETFTTQAAGGELALPDGRQWEMVSPPIKDGSRILPIQEGGGAVQAAADGSAFTYLASAPIEANPAGNGNETQLLSTRGPEGWSTRNLEPPHTEADNASIGGGQEYRVFSPDLSEGIVQPFTGRGGEALISPEATEYTIYLHNDADDGAGGMLPLVTAANVPAGTKFKGEENGAGRVEFVDATPDLSHVLLTARAALTPTSVEDGLYEWSAGQLQLVSRFPETGAAAGAPACYTSVGDSNSADTRGAVSGDGSRIVWSCSGDGRQLYLRDTTKQETLRLDQVQGGSGAGEERAEFQLAAADATRVFFLDSQQLTADAQSGTSLYECAVVEVAGKLTCQLTDLTVSENAGEVAGAGVVLGASEDGSYVYFVDGGVLAGGASPGNCGEFAASSELCNVYVRHDGVTRFIAALSPEDAHWGSLADGNLRALTARVSPDGHYLELMSDRSLTGYDNHDAGSGAADEEVYLYDAESNHLVCASCNPTGARPSGIEISAKNEPLAANERIWDTGRWLAANVPGWTGLTLDSARYQSRYLSDSGRLFFNSSDALVPQDTDGTEDVYEYEPAGIGSCTEASATYSARSDGCVDLISAGASAEESFFMDASENGEDVFFGTTSQLVSQDVDDAYDVYDARVCTSASPCPTAVVSAPPCTTADACRAAPAPQPGLFGEPASQTFSGSGNLTPASVNAKPQPKKRQSRRSKRKKHKRESKVHGAKGKQGRRAARKSKSKAGKAARNHGPRAAKRSKSTSLSARTSR